MIFRSRFVTLNMVQTLNFLNFVKKYYAVRNFEKKCCRICLIEVLLIAFMRELRGTIELLFFSKQIYFESDDNKSIIRNFWTRSHHCLFFSKLLCQPSSFCSLHDFVCLMEQYSAVLCP